MQQTVVLNCSLIGRVEEFVLGNKMYALLGALYLQEGEKGANDSTIGREAAWPIGLGRWIWNLEFPGSNPPPYCYLIGRPAIGLPSYFHRCPKLTIRGIDQILMICVRVSSEDVTVGRVVLHIRPLRIWVLHKALYGIKSHIMALDGIQNNEG